MYKPVVFIINSSNLLVIVFVVVEGQHALTMSLLHREYKTNRV